MHKAIGIDLGTTELRLSVPANGIVRRMPSVIAVNQKTKKRMLKFGSFAQKAVAEHPSLLKLMRSFEGSVLEDPELAKRIFAWCLHEIYPDETGVRALYSVPCSLSDAEECAIVEMLLDSGFKEAFLVYSPVAALIGGGYSLKNTYVSVNIGARTTDIAVVSDGKIIDRASVLVGGDAFCNAVSGYVEKKHHMRISFPVAERVKRTVGTVWLDGETRVADLVGIDGKNACKQTTISSEEMFTALEEPCALLLDAICSAAAKIPLERVSDAMDGGIVLSGGGAFIRGLSNMIEGITGFPCRIPEAAADAVARGLAASLDRLPQAMMLHNASLVAVKCFY